jgi:hypothetical protein
MSPTPPPPPFTIGSDYYFEVDDRVMFTNRERKREVGWFVRYEGYDAIICNQDGRHEQVDVYSLKWHGCYDDMTVKIDRILRLLENEMRENGSTAVTKEEYIEACNKVGDEVFIW